MSPHLHQPDIVRLLASRLSEADIPRVYRHLDDCELCLRRVIEAEGGLGSSGSAGQIDFGAEGGVKFHTAGR
jgi:hypothetical protein